VPIWPTDLLWFPLIVLTQLVLTTGLALFISALTVHFRDVRDLLANLLTLWFFATPIIYPLSQAPRTRATGAEPESVHASRHRISGSALQAGPVSAGDRLIAVAAASVVVFLIGYFVFDRLRDTLAEEV
jgi:ABC-type polysaccharide/polyol phosphate export permease